MPNRKIRIRDAKDRDLGLFRKLWRLYLEENESTGSIIACTDKNLAQIESVFKQYVADSSIGFVLFVGDYAILMAGSSLIPTEHNCGKTAMCWGIFVREDRRKGGVAAALIKEAKTRLKNAGFDTVMTPFTAGNEAAGLIAMKYEAKPVIVSVRLSLDD